MTNIKKHGRLFNRIAWAYQYFYKGNLRGYSKKIELILPELNLTLGSKILDVGCGPGALGSAFQNMGFDVAGVDLAQKMVNKANKNGLKSFQGDVLGGLNDPDDSFNLVVAGYVAHGLNSDQRVVLMKEMKRLSNGKVLFHDFGVERSTIITIVEYMEGSDYVNFKKNPTKSFKTKARF